MSRKGAAKYTPMSSPHPDRVRLPDVDLLRSKKQLRLVQEIATVAWQNLMGIRGPTGGFELSQALGTLEYRLLGLMNSGSEQDPPDTPAIVSGARLGYVIGTMENGSGVAHNGQCEAHYTTAMVMLSTRLSEAAPPTAMSEFATECGYYLARTNDRTLDALTKIANQNAEKLGAVPPAQEAEVPPAQEAERHFTDDGYPWGAGWWENLLMASADGAITTGQDGLAFYTEEDDDEEHPRWEYAWADVNSVVIERVDDLEALTAHPDLARDLLDYAMIVFLNDPFVGLSESHSLVVLTSKEFSLAEWKTLFADHGIECTGPEAKSDDDDRLPNSEMLGDPQPTKWAVPSAGLREPQNAAAPGWWQSPEGHWNPPGGGSPIT